MEFSDLPKVISELPHEPVQLVLIIGVLAVGGWLIKRAEALLRSVKSQVSEVHERTVNDHAQKANMRDQLDVMEAMMRAGFADLRGDIRGLHKDVSVLHGAVGGVRRELHSEVERSTRADDRLERRLDGLDASG